MSPSPASHSRPAVQPPKKKQVMITGAKSGTNKKAKMREPPAQQIQTLNPIYRTKSVSASSSEWKPALKALQTWLIELMISLSMPKSQDGSKDGSIGASVGKSSGEYGGSIVLVNGWRLWVRWFEGGWWYSTVLGKVNPNFGVWIGAGSHEALNSLWVGVVSARMRVPGLTAQSMCFGCEVSAVNLPSYEAQSNVRKLDLHGKGERLQIVRTTLRGWRTRDLETRVAGY